MNKRKFSLGEIVSKLNRESAETQASPSPPQSSPTRPEGNESAIPKNVADLGRPENTNPDHPPLSDNKIPPQPDYSQTGGNHFGKKSKIHEIENDSNKIIHEPGSTHTHIAQNTFGHSAGQNQLISNTPVSSERANVQLFSAQNSSGLSPLPQPSVNLDKFNTDENEDEEESLDILKYVGILFRRRYIIMAIAILAAIFSVYRYTTSDKYFVSSARLLFSPDLQDIANDNRFFFVQMDRDKLLNTHLELLKSPTVLNLVAENLGNSISPGIIAAGLSITQGETNGEKNDIIELSYKCGDSEMARDVLNELCRTYIDYRREVNSQEVSRLISKLEIQINKLQTELNDKENDLRFFKEENQMVQLSSETNITISKLSEMELSLQKTNLDIIESRERQQELKSQISNQELNIVQSITYSDPFKNRLSELELELNTISSEYSPEHFKVKSIKDKIERLKEVTVDSMSREAASKTMVKNPIRQSMVHDLVNLTIEISALETKRIAQEKIKEQLNAELLKLPHLEQRYVFLQRETESLIQTLRILKTRYEEAKIKKDSQESDLKFLEMALTPGSPIRKVKFTIILIGLFAGIIIGIALALVVEYLDQSLKDPLEVEKNLELPLLGIVPHIEADQELFEQTDLTKNILEPFRALRANLKHIASTHKLKTFIICSAVKGEGKTTLSANLAITFAVDGKKVILIDADLRRSQMHTLFNISKKTGLSDYLLGTSSVDEILKPTKFENLFLITSGERPNNPAELLGTWRFDTLIQELRDRGDIVIFDSPALLPVSDTITMAPKMDGCLMVVRTLWTPTKAARQAKNQLKRIGCRIFGGILNGVVHSKGYYPYYYSYYGYYSYKYTYDDDTHKKFSFREFGLKIESTLKNQTSSLWLGIPKFIARLVNIIQYILSKPLIWILLLISTLLFLAQLYIESKYQPLPNKTIEYLGTGKMSDTTDSSALFNDMANLHREVSGERHPENIRFIDSIGLEDSLKHWLFAKEHADTIRFFGFYHPDFKFQDGTLEDWKRSMIENLSRPNQIRNQYILDDLQKKKIGNDFVEVIAYIKSTTVSGISEQKIGMIWKYNGSKWKIIREQELFQSKVVE